MDETQLAEAIAACRRRDSAGFAAIVDEYSRRLYGFFYRLSGDRTLSDDLLSELFVKVVERIDSFNDGSFEKWLFAVASNLFYDHLRRKQRQQKLTDHIRKNLDAQDEGRCDPEPLLADDMQKKLAILDDETRELILLRFYSDLSFRQIADLRSQPLGTVLSRIHRGLKRLRETMKETI